MLNRRAGFHPSATALLVTSWIGAVMLLQAPTPDAVELPSPASPGTLTTTEPNETTAPTDTGASNGTSSPNGTSEATEASDAADPVQRFLARVDEPLVRYRARRTLRARNERFNKEGWITARTELDPATGFTFEILEEGGSGYIRSRVLRKALEAEREAVVAGEPARAALSAANYKFSTAPGAAAAASTEASPIEAPRAGAPAVDGPPLETLRIIPLRKDKLLVDGTITVTAADGDLVRIEGRLVKNPSFWTNRVEIVRRYGRIEGIRVPLAIESTANVKIAGTSVFSMTYEYESINGRPVSPAAQAAAARLFQ